MSIQTTVELKGVLGNKTQTCHFTSDGGPETIFRGRTARELFLQSVPNPGCADIQEKDVQIHIGVRRKCSFGIAGFTENNVQEASRKARKLQAKSDADLFEEGLPDPDDLFVTAVQKFLEGDKGAVSALASTFEFFAKTTMGVEIGQDSGKLFLEAAAKMAAEVNYPRLTP